MDSLGEIAFVIEFIEQKILDWSQVRNTLHVKSAMVNSVFSETLAKGKGLTIVDGRNFGNMGQSTQKEQPSESASFQSRFGRAMFGLGFGQLFRFNETSSNFLTTIMRM